MNTEIKVHDKASMCDSCPKIISKSTNTDLQLKELEKLEERVS